jgi:hypothetical protein
MPACKNVEVLQSCCPFSLLNKEVAMVPVQAHGVSGVDAVRKQLCAG